MKYRREATLKGTQSCIKCRVISRIFNSDTHSSIFDAEVTALHDHLSSSFSGITTNSGRQQSDGSHLPGLQGLRSPRVPIPTRTQEEEKDPLLLGPNSTPNALSIFPQFPSQTPEEVQGLRESYSQVPSIEFTVGLERRLSN